MHQAHGLPVLTLPALSTLTYEVETIIILILEMKQLWPEWPS